MAITPKQKSRSAIQNLNKAFYKSFKEDDEYRLAFTGRGDTDKTVLVPNKPGYIFVRIPKSISGTEITEYVEQIALSKSEFRHNVPVMLGKSSINASILEVKGLWPITLGGNKVQTIGESVALHRSSHELYSPHGGHDPVFLDSLQIRNMQVTPTSPPSSRVVIGGGWYVWKDRQVHWYDGTIVELANEVPSGSFANYVSLWLDPSDQSIVKHVETQNIAGFALTKEDLIVWPEQDYIPLACIRLLESNYQVTWSNNNVANFIDMRIDKYMMPGDLLPAGHPLDPSGGYHTGTLDAVHVSLRDTSGGFLYNNLHDIMENEVMHWSGTLRSIYQDYVPKADEVRVLNFVTGTNGGFVVNYEGNGVASVTGTFGSGGSGGANALDDLTDVTLSSVAQGDLLTRGASDWNNVNISTQSVVARLGSGNVVAVSIAEQRIVGRITGGDVSALTATQVKTLLAIDHGTDLSGLSDDDHTQYALLAGRSSGQTLIGGTASGEDLTLNSTAHATKGSVFLAGGLAEFDEANQLVGIGGTPGAKLQVTGTADDQQLIVKGNGTQTSDILQVLKSDNTTLLLVNNSGDLTAARHFLPKTDNTSDIGTTSVGIKNAYITTAVLPVTDNTSDIGSTTKTFRAIYGNADYYVERIAPSTPGSGLFVVYAKTDGLLYGKNDAGTEYDLTAGGSGANTALSNLAAVAINTTLVSDTDNTDDLGSSSIKWRAAYANAFYVEERSAPSTPSSGDGVFYEDTEYNPRFISAKGQDKILIGGSFSDSFSVSDSTTAQTLSSVTVKANTMGTKGVARTHGEILYFNNSGATRTLTFTYTFGSYTYSYTATGLTSGATNYHSIWAEIITFMNQATNAQNHIFAFFGSAIQALEAAPAAGGERYAHGSSAVDETADITVSLTVALTNATPTQTLRGAGGMNGPHYNA